MAATLPKTTPPPRPRRKPRRRYVVVDQATEDSDAGASAVDAWLTAAAAVK